MMTCRLELIEEPSLPRIEKITGVGPKGKETRGTFDLDFKVNVKVGIKRIKFFKLWI
ncbi:MAG: hypothetical protein CM15mV24_0260 [Bellamyvirus sp.]|nr:MAG: hypothetical protein CM15mV24_0260 [Bellamyvirus sp.]